MGRGRGGAGSSRPASVHVDDFEGKGMPQLKSNAAAKTVTPPKQVPPLGPPPAPSRPNTAPKLPAAPTISAATAAPTVTLKVSTLPQPQRGPLTFFAYAAHLASWLIGRSAGAHLAPCLFSTRLHPPGSSALDCSCGRALWATMHLHVQCRDAGYAQGIFLMQQ